MTSTLIIITIKGKEVYRGWRFTKEYNDIMDYLFKNPNVEHTVEKKTLRG